MDKEDLIDFLKENLTISIEEFNDFYDKGLKIKLELDGETITKSSVVTEINSDF
jgi:hypothetical protein